MVVSQRTQDPLFYAAISAAKNKALKGSTPVSRNIQSIRTIKLHNKYEAISTIELPKPSRQRKATDQYDGVGSAGNRQIEHCRASGTGIGDAIHRPSPEPAGPH